MDSFVANWEAVVNIAALIFSAIGVVFSIAAFIQARKARTAADASERASQKTQDSLTNILTVVDLQKAIAAIQRLKLLHREESWEACLENYQPLRSMLADIGGRQTSLTDGQTLTLKEVIPQLAEIENAVAEALRGGIDPSRAGSFDEKLNEMQIVLESLRGVVKIILSTLPLLESGRLPGMRLHSWRIWSLRRATV